MPLLIFFAAVILAMIPDTASATQYLYCAASRAYYPTVTACPTNWQPVQDWQLPRPTPAASAPREEWRDCLVVVSFVDNRSDSRELRMPAAICDQEERRFDLIVDALVGSHAKGNDRK